MGRKKQLKVGKIYTFEKIRDMYLNGKIIFNCYVMAKIVKTGEEITIQAIILNYLSKGKDNLELKDKIKIIKSGE